MVYYIIWTIIEDWLPAYSYLMTDTNTNKHFRSLFLEPSPCSKVVPSLKEAALSLYIFIYVCVCAYVCVCMWVNECVRLYVCVCVCVCVHILFKEKQSFLIHYPDQKNRKYIVGKNRKSLKEPFALHHVFSSFPFRANFVNANHFKINGLPHK